MVSPVTSRYRLNFRVNVRVLRTLFITVVPSPYQRDLFRALAVREEIALSVCYLESTSPDSPWPEVPLQPYERILPGFWVPFGGARWHVNWGFPDLASFDFVILSSYTSAIGQWLMRSRLREQRWLFWGERLRLQASAWKRFVQDKLTAPLARATGIVGVGHAAENDYRHRFPRTFHFCIPYYCDVSHFLAQGRRPVPASEITFFFCGQMNRRKGVDLLLTAFDRLVGKGLNVHLLLVGREAELPQFLRQISPASCRRITYAGFQPPERLPEYFSKADVFVLPSRYDGWGVVVNQALAAGLPIVCSDSVGAGLDLVEENVNGLRFAAGNADELQRCMEQVAPNPDVASTWGQISRQKAQTLAPEAGAAKWIEVFSTLLNKAARRAA
jgi:glycosyltransferase involved in cell wall biosynthesis